MKSTLSDVGQLFNVKAFTAAGKDPSEIAEGEFAIVDSATNLTIYPANYAALPDKFRLISKLNGKIYIGADTIKKGSMLNQVATDYKAAQVNIWKGTVKSCDCIKGVQLGIFIDEDELIRRDGLTWTHKDNLVEVAPEELTCQCDCTGKSSYDNNIMTKILAEKINALNSPYYSASIELDVSAVDVYADEAARDLAVVAPVIGDLVVVTGEGTQVYDGAAWATIGDEDGNISDVDTFIAAFKDANTDSDPSDDGPLLNLILTGKAQPAGNYNDLEVNYVYPRGVRITPTLTVNSDKSIIFEEIQKVGFEIGAGYDLRALEWDFMNNYTNLNTYTRLSDGIQAPGLVYQMENGKNYSSVTIEFDSEKVERAGDGDKKRFFVVFASETISVYNRLKAIFIP